MARLLTAGILALPLAGATVFVLTRKASPRRAPLLAVALAAAASAGSLALLPHADSGPMLTLRWLPGTGLMELSLGSTGLYAAAATACALLLALFGSVSHNPGLRSLSGSVIFLASAAASVALLAEHFLLRYLALELVALCIALALPIGLRGQPGYRRAWHTYLILRVGDAGLLAAILILWSVTGTLNIKAALASATAADVSALTWIVAGLVAAIWIKMGLWPLHGWTQHGHQLCVAQESWLYATVMPTLGLYLLYRVTPLLSIPGVAQSIVQWMGAGGAVLGVLSLFRADNAREGIALLSAGLGGVALSAAASGVKSAAWLTLMVSMPLRVLLFLAADAAASARALTSRRAAAGLFGLGGGALVAFGLLVAWWARSAQAESGPLILAQTAIVLAGIWVVRTAGQLAWHSQEKQRKTVHWTQWVTIALLGATVMAAAVRIHRVVERLAEIAHMEAPALPGLPALLHHWLTTPSLWLALLAAAVVRRIYRPESSVERPIQVERGGEGYALEEGLARAAQALRGVVEAGALERALNLAVQTVVQGARLAHDAVESESLERAASASARVIAGAAQIAHEVMERGTLERIVGTLVGAVAGGASFAYHVIETEGLEGLLRRSVRGALALGKGLQRAHTGRLRYNLLWVSVSLVLATLGFILWTW